MPITPGTNLGPYEVTAPIGAGGMGEVYRARDTKLNRDVAIKVLPTDVAQNSERLARFRREAQVLASLNHPLIAAIHGLEEIEGHPFLVLELAEGEDLSERLKRGSIPLEEALEISRQIAEALDAAHEKGIVHRDLKPANLKLTPDGDIKVLDFGLAKAYAGEAAGDSDSDRSQSPTLSRATAAGVILGTAAYMSPEQAKGKTVDKRTDIWAFGCVVYEMLTGKKAFAGEDISETLAAIPRAEPDWQALPADTPDGVHSLLRRCLRKNPKQRLHDIADARIDIEEIQKAPEDALPNHPPKLRHRAAPWILAVVATGVALWSLMQPEATTAPPTVKRFIISLPEEEPLALGVLGRHHPSIALSPDGSGFAYIGLHNGVRRLYLRPLDGFDSHTIPETEGAFHPFFSSDSRWVGFFTEGHLKKVSFEGGEPVTICEARNPAGATWGSENMISFAQGSGRVLSRVSADGGTPKNVTSGGRWPSLLPGSEDLLVSLDRILWVSPRKGETKSLLEQGAQARYVPTGHLVYVHPGRLMAVPFDLEALEVTGSPVPVLEGVRTGRYRFGQVSFSRDGTLVYVPGDPFDKGSPVWVDREGRARSLGFPDDIYGTFQLSPDRRRLAIVIKGTNSDIWVCDLDRGTRNRLTFEGGNFPIWTPDGKWVVFTSRRDERRNLYKKSADGSGEVVRLTTSKNLQIPYSWSANGKWLAYSETTFGSGLGDIWILPADGGDPERLIGSKFHESFPAFSPDGSWLAYTSDESGANEVYAQRFPVGDGGTRQRISAEGGQEPVWSPSGEELIFRSGNKVMSVAIQMEPDFVAGTPRTLFDGRSVDTDARSHDVSADGRLLIIQPSEPSTTT